MYNKNILIHLHPDFGTYLKDVLDQWNHSQSTINFIPVLPKQLLESKLLSFGSISDDNASIIAAQIRTEAGFSPDSGIIIFTEKRLYDNEYYQLFVGGKEKDETPPNIGILSLGFLRSLYKSTKNDSNHSLFFRGIILNILFSIGIDTGLNEHTQTTRGCAMDFCSNMTDIKVGIENGPKFCSECTDIIKKEQATYLLKLVDSFNDIPKIEQIDKDVTENILTREKVYNKYDKDCFDYDVALSFAGEDRKYVEPIAIELSKQNIKVFYDKFEKANLWGKELHIYLKDVYRLRAKYCIIFISNSYVLKNWTNLELTTALAREFELSREYILPIKLDETDVSGILPTKAFLYWEEESVESIVEIVLSKLDYCT